jgi:hypothetical protein
VLFKDIINATPDLLRIYDERGARLVLELPPSGIVASIDERAVVLANAVGSGLLVIPLRGTAYGSSIGLPEPQDGVYFVVELSVALTARDRTDLLVCGPAICDVQDRMVGCRGLSVTHHPLAAPPEPRGVSPEDLVSFI